MVPSKLRAPTLQMLITDDNLAVGNLHVPLKASGGCDHMVLCLLSPLGGWAAGALAGAAGAGGGAWGAVGAWLLFVARRTSMRQVGHVCCLWNQERRQLGGFRVQEQKGTFKNTKAGTTRPASKSCLICHIDSA